MDLVDVALLRAMGLRRFDPARGADAIRAASLARAVGTTVDTVRARVERMERDGVLAGYEVFPNLRHLGLTGEAYLVRARSDGEKEAVLAEASQVRRVVEVHDFLGSAVCVDFAYADRSERDATLARLAAASGMPTQRFYGRDMPPVLRELTPLDWRVLAALRGNAKRPLPEVADEIGVSARTVKRRLERMAEEGAFFVFPLLDLSKAGGVILFKLLVHIARDAGADTLQLVQRELDDHMLLSFVPSTRDIGSFDVVLMALTPSGIDELRRRVMSVAGVESAEPWLLRGFQYRGEWIDADLQARAQTPRVQNDEPRSRNA